MFEDVHFIPYRYGVNVLFCVKEEIMTVRYAEDKPKDCRYCNFWNEKNKECRLGVENCYYLVPDEEMINKKKSICDGCPYGRNAPCIGFCMKKIIGN